VPLQNNDKNSSIREKIEDGKPVMIKDQTKNVLIEHRRTLSLCFKCAEKYYFGHQCKVKVHMLIGREEEEVEEEHIESSSECIEPVEDALMSMFAMSSNTYLRVK
jgi:hypothetical protein